MTRTWARPENIPNPEEAGCNSDRAQYSKTPSLRSPEIEDSLSDVASRSFRRLGEVGRTTMSTSTKRLVSVALEDNVSQHSLGLSRGIEHRGKRTFDVSAELFVGNSGEVC